MAGGLQGYQQFAQAEMIMNAGEGMKKHGGQAVGNAMAGAGIGLGFGMPTSRAIWPFLTPRGLACFERLRERSCRPSVAVPTIPWLLSEINLA